MLSNLFLMTNPKLNSKVQVQEQVDDWFFIKIVFFNYPQPGKVSKKQDTVIYLKQKLSVYNRML